ncbi:MAG: HD domain-containing protein, partial [Flavobacteriaceae bacterium]|nr:HD domain-containing protein [Flavobacteriaceae bacterium]
MNNQQLIDNTKQFVKDTLKNAEGGHDWFHTERVYKNALLISKGETVNELVVRLGALLHDIADSKFNNGDDTIGPKIAAKFLVKQNVATDVINHVIKIIENVSFSSNIDKTAAFHSKELEVIQ